MCGACAVTKVIRNNLDLRHIHVKIVSPDDCIEGRILCLRVLLFVNACTGSSTALYHLQLLFDDIRYQKYGYGNLLAGSFVYIPGNYLLAEVIYSSILFL
jgi:hypothetical protein